MAQFTVNATRFDPYKNFKFRVKWDGQYVAGHQQVRGAEADHRSRRAPRGRRPEHVAGSRRAGPSTRRSRSSAASPTTSSSSSGPTRCGTSAPGSARRSRSRTSARTSSSRSTTRPASWRSRTRSIRCWVSEYQALPDLDANANAVAIQHIKLENEGMERDFEVPEPAEPSFVEP